MVLGLVSRVKKMGVWLGRDPDPDQSIFSPVVESSSLHSHRALRPIDNKRGLRSFLGVITVS